MPSTILQIENLKKTYPGLNRQVLSGLCLSIRQGEIYGFLGPNGAGKTTTVNIITGMLQADSGKIEMFGRPYEGNTNYIKQHIGVVPQNIAVFPDLTAYENLRIFGVIYGMDSKMLDDRIHELLDLFGLMAFKDKKVASFSGGMKRSVNLMVGILHKPDLLILDEPTAVLTPQETDKLFAVLRNMREDGKAIITSPAFILVLSITLSRSTIPTAKPARSYSSTG